ncbi:MAG: Uroporphyrinogen-III synthase [Catillopecten margaritatus gill symbiont]|uniref:Uroporphyrinogen-III synthase n=1 Tax=Catillopecten margaritatus gill symbiont TaxID=3083288 RepID=A0AAU6PGY3_9GAMM
MQILLTRALSQVQPLQALLSEQGYQPILFPSLEIKSLNNKPLKVQYDALIFISANAVEYGLEVFKGLTHSPKIFAVGEATAKKLEQKGVKVDAFPRQKASSEALLAMDEIKVLNNQSILIFRGEGGRETLKQGLEKDNTVEYIEVYQRVPCHLTSLHRESLSRFLQNDEGIVTATSVENLTALMSMVVKINMGAITQHPLVVLSERIKIVAQSLGFKQIIITQKTSDLGLLTAIQTIS